MPLDARLVRTGIHDAVRVGVVQAREMGGARVWWELRADRAGAPVAIAGAGAGETAEITLTLPATGGANGVATNLQSAQVSGLCAGTPPDVGARSTRASPRSGFAPRSCNGARLLITSWVMASARMERRMAG
jgi:hypothetical protein